MSNNKKPVVPVGQSDKRRTVLKKILASGGVITVGSGLPDSWKRPVMDAVTLPAHAQTSPKENGGVVKAEP